jgi:hypothetical protein
LVKFKTAFETIRAVWLMAFLFNFLFTQSRQAAKNFSLSNKKPSGLCAFAALREDQALVYFRHF